MWASIPISVKRCDTALWRLLDLERWPRRGVGNQVLDGFRVAWNLSDELARMGNPPTFLAIAIRPLRFVLHPEGKEVRLQLKVWGESEGAGGGSPRPLTPGEVGARLIQALTWPAGEKVLVPRESDVLGLTGFDVYVCGRSQAEKRAGPHRTASVVAQKTPPAVLFVRCAWVAREAEEVARQWADAMGGGSLRPVVLALGLPVDRCVENPDVQKASWLAWLGVGFYLDGWPEGDKGVVRVAHVFVDGKAMTFCEDGATLLQEEAHAEAGLSVARVWPGAVGLGRLPDDGPYVQFSVHLGVHPVVPEATQPLALVAMRELLRGRPLEALRSRLQAMWENPEQLRALSVLSSL